MNQTDPASVEQALRWAVAIDGFLWRHHVTPRLQADWQMLRGDLKEDVLSKAARIDAFMRHIYSPPMSRAIGSDYETKLTGLQTPTTLLGHGTDLKSTAVLNSVRYRSNLLLSKDNEPFQRA